MAIVYMLSLGALLGAHALPQDFGVKSVKGGHGNEPFRYNANQNLNRFYNSSQQNQSEYHSQNQYNSQVQSGSQVLLDNGQELQSQHNQFHGVPQGGNLGPSHGNSQQQPPATNFQFYGEGKDAQRNNQYLTQHQFIVQNQQQRQNQLAAQNQQTQQNQFGGQRFVGQTFNLSGSIDYEKGVCYEEIPTSKLARDPSHIPAGNGSMPQFSRIRVCCIGYIRNLHNFRICDPVCSKGCVNALCTAPEVCSCFPDHVINHAGFCMPTCPIGCQNGVCAGGECMCHEGYQLDARGKFCVPLCKAGCGSSGNCTAPNTCECQKGYQSTPLGSCAPHCEGCAHGDCVAPGQCRCPAGYHVADSDCVPSCPRGCSAPGKCTAPDQCSCPPGYRLDGTNQCVPENINNAHTGVLPIKLKDESCSHPCINGVCQNGLCNCKTGYVPDQTDPTGNRCIPSCPRGCPNGVCSAPNFCICNFGFVKDQSVKGGATCIRRQRRSIQLTYDIEDEN